MRTLIKNGVIVTMNERRDVLDGGFILIEDQRIALIGTAAQCPQDPCDRVIDAQGSIAIPGLINMHQHPHMNLVKGLADGMLLEPWVFGFSTPMRKHVNAADFAVATSLSAIEMIATGTTCVLNHQSMFDFDYRSIVVETMASVGIRHVLALPFQCRTPKMPNHPFSAEQAADDIEAFHAEWDGSNQGTTRVALVVECNAHHTELGRSSDELVRAGHALAVKKDMVIACHMSGGTLAMNMGFTKYRRQTGRSDVEYLERLGVLDGHWILKHGIHFSDDDIATVAARGASVVYTPTSESMRGGGMGPWKSMLRAGVNCALGTDGPAVDYSVDMLEQVRACCYLQSVRYHDADAVDAMTALEMATIGAARALGLDASIGSLEAGKLADIVLVEASRPHQLLVSDKVERLVRTARGSAAKTVFVNGDLVLDNGRLTKCHNGEAILTSAIESGVRVAQQSGLNAKATPRWPVSPVSSSATSAGRH